MSFQLQTTEKIRVGVRRIALEQIEKALLEIDDQDIPRHDVVHQVRKRCKKLRGLVRLVRPAFGKTYKDANQMFRDAARRLSDLRDAKSMVVTCDDLLGYFQSQIDRSAFATIRQSVNGDLQQIDDRDVAERLSQFRETMIAAKKSVKCWELSESGVDAIRDGFIKTHRRARNRLADAMEGYHSELLHQLRKRTKYHWYHLRLLGDVWPPVMKSYRRQAKKLSDLLGDEHDYAVLRKAVLSDAKAGENRKELDVFVALLDARRRRLADTSIAIAQRVYAEPSELAAERVQAVWKTWRSEKA